MMSFKVGKSDDLYTHVSEVTFLSCRLSQNPEDIGILRPVESVFLNLGPQEKQLAVVPRILETLGCGTAGHCLPLTLDS